MKTGLAALAFGFLFAVSTAAKPERCGGKRPFVAVQVPNELGAAAFRDQLVAQLRASLSPKGIDVCKARDSAPGEAIAIVTLAPHRQRRVTITVEAHDEVTQKRVARDIDLTSLPSDAWPLALAVASDEVLRASWAELALKTRARQTRPAPEPVREVVRDSMLQSPAPQAGSRTITIGAGGVAEAFSGGHTQAGVDLRVGAAAVMPISVVLTAGLRAGIPTDSPTGRVSSSALVVGAGPHIQLTSAGTPVGVDVGLRAQAMRLEFRGDAQAGGKAHSGNATAITALAAAGVHYAPDPALRILLEVGALLPIREAAARDGDQTASAVEGFGGSIALGLAGVL